MKNKSLIFAILFLVVSVVLVFGLHADANSTAKKSKKVAEKIAAAQERKKRLKKDMSFDDHAVGGQYQIPYGSMTVVEDEKALDDLIGVRKNFTDRIDQSKGMR